MSDPIIEESEVNKGRPGFTDPEVRQRASERSLAVRRGEVPEKVPAFVPSKNQLAVLKIALDLESGDSVRGWFSKAGLNRGAWFEWHKNPEFREWWKREFAEGIKEYETKWILIGLKRMGKDFRYWNEVGKKLFGFIDKITVKEEKSPEESALLTELVGLFQSFKGVQNINNLPSMRTQAEIIDVDVVEQELIQELKEGQNANNV